MNFFSNQKYDMFFPKCCECYIIILVIVWSFLLSSCSFLLSPNIFLKNSFDEYKIQRVAVLPFYNRSTTVSAGEIVTKAFTEKLYSSRKFEIGFPGDIKKFIVGERIIIRKGIGADHIKMLGKRLNIDAIIIGCVEKYEIEGQRKDVRIPIVSVDARMIHTDSCSILWIGHNYRRGDDYETIFGIGRISSLPALSRKVVNELIDPIP